MQWDLVQLPPPDPGHEYPLAVYEGQTYVATGQWPIGAAGQARPRALLHRTPSLVLDVDLKDVWMAADPALTKEAAAQRAGQATREELEEGVADLASLLSRALAHLELPPTAVVGSGRGLHLYFWLLDDEGRGDASSAQHRLAKEVNRELGKRVNAYCREYEGVTGSVVDLATTNCGTRLRRRQPTTIRP